MGVARQRVQGISVVIPTYNRCETLEKTPFAYNLQTLRKDQFEIIVVDDGSTDQTRQVVARMVDEVSYTLQYYAQQNQRPGAARNMAIPLAAGEIIFITGDDIIPTEDLLWQHLKTHTEFPDKRVAVLGHIEWDTETPISYFMHFLTNVSSAQFGFFSITDPDNASFKFFYTSNISLKKSLLVENELFRKEFIFAACEDIELGYSLEQKGMVIKYNKQALGHHKHPTMLEGFATGRPKQGR